MKTISAWDDIKSIYKELPGAILFDSTINVPPEFSGSEAYEYDHDKNYSGIKWIKHAPFPYPQDELKNAFIKEFSPLFKLIKGGRTVIFKVSPSKPEGIKFALGFTGAMRYYSSGIDINIHNYHETTGDDGCFEIPFPIGIVSDDEGDTAIWTRHWSPSLEQMDALFDGYFVWTPGKVAELLADKIGSVQLSDSATLMNTIRKMIIGVKDPSIIKKGKNSSLMTLQKIRNELSRRCLYLPDRLRFLSEAMKDPLKTWPGKDSSVVIARDAKMGFPTSFALRFGNGAIVVLPDSASSELLTKKIESAASGGQFGYDMLLKTLNAEKSCHPEASHEAISVLSDRQTVLPAWKYTVELLEVSGNIGEKGNISFKINGVKDKISALQFLRFIGLWVSSVGPYNGYGYSRDLDDKYFLKMRRDEKAIDFPCLSIFRSNDNGVPAAFAADRQDCLEKIFRGSLKFDGIKENILKIPGDKRRRPDCESFFYEKLHNVDLLPIPETLMSKLKALVFEAGDKRADEYSKTKEKFFELLSAGLQKAN